MDLTIQKITCARLPTAVGTFELCVYRNNKDDKEHVAIHMGQLESADNVLVRLHSECLTGDIFGSTRCDCGPQLHAAMQAIADEGSGLIIYLRQEGRGIGLTDKLHAYNLQDEGYDTVEANIMLGHAIDEREYDIAIKILEDYNIKSVRLMTNNPEKITALEENGVSVNQRIPIVTGLTEENYSYLRTKASRMNHQLDFDHSYALPDRIELSADHDVSTK